MYRISRDSWWVEWGAGVGMISSSTEPQINTHTENSNDYHNKKTTIFKREVCWRITAKVAPWMSLSLRIPTPAPHSTHPLSLLIRYVIHQSRWVMVVSSYCKLTMIVRLYIVQFTVHTYTVHCSNWRKCQNGNLTFNCTFNIEPSSIVLYD